MDNPPEPPAPSRAPWGHSAAAHRVHGWCADCTGRNTGQEVLAWRTRENRRHEAAALATSQGRRNTVEATATHDHPCPECGQEALTVVTVRLRPEEGEQRPAGGWAHCTACGATPHPVWEDTKPDADNLPCFVDCHANPAPCPACQEPDSLLVADFTATTKAGVYEIGRWSICLACEHTPTAEDPDHG